MATAADTPPLSSSQHDTTNGGPSSLRRGRKSAGCGEKKKKMPQRGMGVEKLERLRVQDSLKRMSEMNLIIPQPPPFPPHIPPHFTARHLPLPFDLHHHHHQNQNQPGFHQFHPPDLDPKCFSQHCHFCHKKKKVVVIGENVAAADWGFLGLNIGGGGDNNTHQQNHHAIPIETKNPFPHTMPYGNNKGVEIVAIHHKKGSSGDVANADHVLMEYEFFPPNDKIAQEEEDRCLQSMEEDVNGHRSLRRHYNNGSSTMVDASSNIDLSLKLSSY